MGYNNWSDDDYTARSTYRDSTGTSAFVYDTKIKSDPWAPKKVHDQMNPMKVTRESRDSDTHPDSVPIMVLFDVTGSMGSIPVVLQKKLSKLMGLLTLKGYVEHPQVLFGAIGDATCDQVPLQIGQFESGIEMDDDLGRIYIEGGGGGQDTESYELGIYFTARHTVTDSYEKRGKKGYLFIIGDERPYPQVAPGAVKFLMGDDLEGPIKIEDIIAEASEKWHVFHIIAREGGRGGVKSIEKVWRDLLGERVLSLENSEAVCETIASTIGVMEGQMVDDVMSDLRDAGVDDRTVKAVSTALVPLTNSALAPAPGGAAVAILPGFGSTALEPPTIRRL